MKKTFNFQLSTFNAGKLLLLVSLGIMALAMPVSADTAAETKMIEALRAIAGSTGGGSANIDATQTAATGTNWTALADHAAKQVTVVNTTGAAISVRYGSGTSMSLPDGSGFTFPGLSNSNGISIKRTDSSNSQVTVAYLYKNW